jgi:hypothetical protein
LRRTYGGGPGLVVFALAHFWDLNSRSE